MTSPKVPETATASRGPFPIIKDAPPPPEKGRRTSTYDFDSMEVGDAFDAPRDMGKYQTGGDRRQASIAGSACGYVKRHNPTAKFTTHLIDENTVRCWRVR